MCFPQNPKTPLNFIYPQELIKHYKQIFIIMSDIKVEEVVDENEKLFKPSATLDSTL
jgi:hypothetical protein